MEVKKIIKDGRVLKHFSQKYGFVFDKEYKYCTDTKDKDLMSLDENGEIYSLRFFDGCFYPYLCLMKAEPKYRIDGYAHRGLKGLTYRLVTDNICEAANAAITYKNDGYYVSVINTKTHKYFDVCNTIYKDVLDKFKSLEV